MEHINVLGYFKDRDELESQVYSEKLLYFVAFENSYNNHLDDKKWVEGFNVMDGHFLIRDEDYLDSCKRITKEEYLNATKGFYTPKEYLED